MKYEYEGKTYFVVGFPNISGGYELRNRYFKGCLAPKDITHIRQQGEQRDVCYLFEGFMDYLSFLTIRMNNNPEEPRTEEQDYMVLNSVTNLSKAEQLLRPYTRIGSFLDNDQAGQRAYENLKKMFGNRASRYVASLRRTQGFERLSMPPKPSKTSREKIASPIRKADTTTAAEEETRLQVIAHYNYTLRLK